MIVTISWFDKFNTAKLKIKPIHVMGWVEYHTAFQDFEDLYEALHLCVETIVPNKGRKKWDAKFRMEVQELRHQIKSLFSLLPSAPPSIFINTYLDLTFHCRVQHWMLLGPTSMLKL